MSGYFDKFSFQVPFQMYGVQLEEYAFSYQRSPHLSAKTESFICLLIRVVATGMPFCVRSIQKGILFKQKRGPISIALYTSTCQAI